MRHLLSHLLCLNSCASLTCLCRRSLYTVFIVHEVFDTVFIPFSSCRFEDFDLPSPPEDSLARNLALHWEAGH